MILQPVLEPEVIVTETVPGVVMETQRLQEWKRQLLNLLRHCFQFVVMEIQLLDVPELFQGLYRDITDPVIAEVSLVDMAIVLPRFHRRDVVVLQVEIEPEVIVVVSCGMCWDSVWQALQFQTLAVDVKIWSCGLLYALTASRAVGLNITYELRQGYGNQYSVIVIWWFTASKFMYFG